MEAVQEIQSDAGTIAQAQNPPEVPPATEASQQPPAPSMKIVPGPDEILKQRREANRTAARNAAAALLERMRKLEADDLEAEASSRRERRERYWAIIGRSHASFPGDAAELQTLMAEMRITADDLADDIALHQDRREIVRTRNEIAGDALKAERKRVDNEAILARLATVNGDTAALLNAAESGAVVVLRDPKLSEMLLRARGWKCLPDGWTSPDGTTTGLLEAVQNQARRDARQIAGLLEGLHKANDQALGRETHFRPPVL